MIHSSHTDYPSSYYAAASMARAAGFTRHDQAVAYRQGVVLALRGGVPCELGWFRRHFPELCRAFECGFEAALGQMRRIEVGA